MSGNRRRRAPARLGPCGTLLIPLVGLVSLLQGCAGGEEAPPRPPATVYTVDLKGVASLCTVPKPLSPTEGKPTEAQMVVRNDGGWCGITVAAPGDQPYAAGLLTGRPAHGRVYVHTVGYSTRVDYTPDRNYAGADSFTVELLPGSPTLHVSVTVQPGVAVPAPAPPPPPAPVRPARPTSRPKKA